MSATTYQTDYGWNIKCLDCKPPYRDVRETEEEALAMKAVHNRIYHPKEPRY